MQNTARLMSFPCGYLTVLLDSVPEGPSPMTLRHRPCLPARTMWHHLFASHSSRFG